ncbi:hypothetical protein ACA910_014338 [Epithemia clementina (nom. ined.)]
MELVSPRKVQTPHLARLGSHQTELSPAEQPCTLVSHGRGGPTPCTTNQTSRQASATSGGSWQEHCHPLPPEESQAPEQLAGAPPPYVVYGLIQTLSGLKWPPKVQPP